MKRAQPHTAADFQRAYTGYDWAAYRPLLATVIRYADPGEILDLGAGLGFFVECCRQYGIPAVGVESSPDGVAAAHRRGVELQQGDLADPLPYGNQRFTAVVLNQVIEHLDPPILPFALREANRVLQTGGTVFVFAPTRWRIKPWRVETHVNLMGPRAVRAVLQQAGFQRVRSLAFGAGGLGVRVGPLAYLVPPLPSSTSCMAVS